MPTVLVDGVRWELAVRSLVRSSLIGRPSTTRVEGARLAVKASQVGFIRY